MRYELAETLTQVLECVTVPTPSLVFFGSAAHSRWKAGFLPDVHMAHLRVEAFEAPET